MVAHHETATGSEYILDALLAEGINTVFGVIGEGNAHFIDRTNDREITFTQARHEQGAVSMADGHARTKHGVAVCTLTHGPGVTNGATGIAAADRDNVPMVILVGGPGIDGREISLQYLDHATFATPISVYQTRIETTARLPEVLKRSFDRARTRSGPVIVEVPTDVQEGEAPGADYHPLDRPRQRVRPDESQLAEAVERLESAKRPAILAGGGATRSNAGEALAAFAEHIGAPIATTFFAKGILPESHPMISGIAGTFMTPANDEFLWDADVLLAVGTKLSGKTSRDGELFADADVIQIDIVEEAIGTYQDPTVGIIGDAQATIEMLNDRTTAVPERAERVIETIAAAPEPRDDGFEQRANEIDPREFTLELADRVPDDAIITVDSGNNTGFPAVYHEVGENGTMFVNGNFGTMGYALPAALGAKATAPNRTVVCYTGDGALIQVIQELETGVRLGLPIIVAILNDRSYGIIRHRQNYIYERETASSFDSPGFVEIAEGFGARGTVVRSANDLGVVTDYLSSDPEVPLVLDVRTIPEISRPGFPPY